MNKKYLVYRHIRKNITFYIGISSNEERPYQIGRNWIWDSIVKKNPNYEVQVLKRDMNESEARELEKMLIYHYGRLDHNNGSLANTSGKTEYNGIRLKGKELLKIKIY